MCDGFRYSREPIDASNINDLSAGSIRGDLLLEHLAENMLHHEVATFNVHLEDEVEELLGGVYQVLRRWIDSREVHEDIDFTVLLNSFRDETIQ